MVFILCFCSGKKANDKNSAENTEIPEIAAAFMKANVPFLRSKVSARDFTLPLLSATQEAKNQKLSDLRGKVVFLNFWATWCGPCRAEMPSMESLYKRFKDKDFVMLAVNCLEKESAVLDFAEEFELTFPIALDTDGGVSQSFGIQAIPTSFIIDREGNIVARLVGSIDWDTPEFHTALEMLLNSK